MPEALSTLDTLATQDLTALQARAIVDAAIIKATELESKMDIAIVDVGGNLKTFLRMDGAWLGSIDIAIRKARTARLFDMPTGDIGTLSQPGGPLYNIEHSNGGLITFPGGVPLRSADGAIIGAIGVSGSTVENDHAVAAAGAEARASTAMNGMMSARDAFLDMTPPSLPWINRKNGPRIEPADL